MVDAFGLLSCIVLSISCTLDFVTEDGSFATHLHATNSHELQYRRNASFDSRLWRSSACDQLAS